MDYKILRGQLFEWCRIPADELANHPRRKVSFIMTETKAEIMEKIGNMMVDELIANNEAGKPTKWVIPCGPSEQYETFIQRVNTERISLKNLYAFQMDEWLDWQGRPYPVCNSFTSLRGTMETEFFNRIDPELAVPKEQIFFPDVNNLDFFDEKIVLLGGIDTVWAGVGAKGMVAFCEPPRSAYYRVSEDEYLNSKTRIVHLNDDTIAAYSERGWGGCYDAIPPMGVTIGFKSMLTAKKIVYMVATGSWKQTVVRVMLFSEPTLEYPVTLFTGRIPKCILCCDRVTATHPMEKIKDKSAFIR